MIKQKDYFQVLSIGITIRHCPICGNKLSKPHFLGRKDVCKEDWEDERLAIMCCYCCSELRAFAHPCTIIDYIYYCDKIKSWVFTLSNPVHRTYECKSVLNDKQLKLFEKLGLIPQDWYNLVDNNRKPRSCK